MQILAVNVLAVNRLADDRPSSRLVHFLDAGLGLLFHTNVCEGRLIGVRIAVSLVLIHGGMQRVIYPFFIYLRGRTRGQPK